MERMNIKLGEGRSLFDPSTRVLIKKDQVLSVPKIQFWNRRLKCGDIVLTELPDTSALFKDKISKKIKEK